MKKARKIKHLQLFDTWEEDNKHLFGNETWKPSLWTQNTWYLTDKWGFTQYDLYNRSTHYGTMLPQKIK